MQLHQRKICENSIFKIVALFLVTHTMTCIVNALIYSMHSGRCEAIRIFSLFVDICSLLVWWPQNIGDINLVSNRVCWITTSLGEKPVDFTSIFNNFTHRFELVSSEVNINPTILWNKMKNTGKTIWKLTIEIISGNEFIATRKQKTNHYEKCNITLLLLYSFD